MAVTDFVVAIEIASSKITGIAGKRNADGSIHILAKESENSSDCVKKGAIFNLDKTSQLLSNIIKRLEDKLGSSIKKTYIGIGGKSLRSIVNPVKREFNEETKVSQALIDNIMLSNKELPLVDMELLHVEPQEYKIGNDFLTEPVGINAESIEANFVDIIARPSLKENIIKCFRHTGCEIADFLISPVETANAILSDTEKRSGCVLVDMGAETTTVSIYKNNILRHIAVIPLGGKNITKDITSLQIEEYEAEELKQKYGSAYTEESDDPEYQDKAYTLNGKYTIESIKLENIIEGRVNEILMNVNNQISLSKYGDKLMAGAILTGGASNMPNMDVAFKRITKIEQIRIAKECNIQSEGLTLPSDGTNNTLLGLLAAGKENCCRVDPRVGHVFSFDEPVEKPTPVAEEEKQAEEPVEEAVTETVEEPKVQPEPQVESQVEPHAEPVSQTESIETIEMTSATKAPEEKVVEIVEEPKPKTEEEIKAELLQRKKDCQTHINFAANYIETRRYSEALVEIDLAREYNIEAKKLELDSLEKEAKRLQEEAEKLTQIRENQRQKDIERRRRLKEDCQRAIQEAEELLEKGDKREAEKRAQDALSMGVSELEDQIQEILEKTKSEPKKKGWFKKAFYNIIKGADDIMKD